MVVLTSVVLVLATAGVVAVVGHGFGLPWPVARVLGAVVAPTDATAVTAIATGLPRRHRLIPTVAAGVRGSFLTPWPATR